MKTHTPEPCKLIDQLIMRGDDIVMISHHRDERGDRDAADFIAAYNATIAQGIDPTAVGDIIQRAKELVELLAEYPESDLLSLDSDPHPPSAIGCYADALRKALAKGSKV